MSEKRQDTYRLPAEWEPQSAVQLTWPHEATDWRDCLDDITRTFIELARAITRFEQIIIVTPDAEKVRRQLHNELTEVAFQRVIFHQCPTNDTWARDHGGITLVGESSPATAEEALVLDFRFNGWGEKFPWQFDNAITKSLSGAGVLAGRLEPHDDFVLEGGAIESDGKGTVFTTSHCLLAPNRNQPLDRDGIEQQLKSRLRAERIVWLDHGSLIGDDTDGHIDTTVRVAPNDTLLYIRCDDPADPHFDDFQALEAQLQTLRTDTGKPYRLLALPFPAAIHDSGDRLPATYANFLVINGAVICPTYNQPDTDSRALRVIAEAYPDREIIPIDAQTIIQQHGSIHCLTMQYPRLL